MSIKIAIIYLLKLLKITYMLVSLYYNTSYTISYTSSNEITLYYELYKCCIQNRKGNWNHLHTRHVSHTHKKYTLLT